MAHRKLNFNLRFAATAVLLLAAVVLLNGLVGSVGLARFDLTEDGNFTVSESAERILGELKVPVQVKFYMTERSELPPELQTLERNVVDKLNEFAVISGGNLSYSVVDPSKDDELAERIAAKGIRPFQVQSIERDAMGIKLVYSAMEVTYLDKDPEILPQVLPQSLQTLEYDLCTAVTKLIRDIDPVVAVYGSKKSLDPQLLQLYMQMGQTPPEIPDPFQNTMRLLQGQSYDVRRTTITAESPIPDEAATLVVLAPRDLDERQRYEINRFVQSGGNLVVAAQNYEFNYTPGRQGGFSFSAVPQSSGIDPLLSQWGVQISDRVLMDSNNEVLAIPSERNIGGMRVQVSEPVQAAMQIKITEDQIAGDTSIANGLSSMLYLWGSRLELDLETMVSQEIRYAPLFTTSGDVWELDYSGGPLVASNLVPDPDSELSREPLAVLLQGTFPNAYPEGNKPRWTGVADSVAVDEPVEEFTPIETSIVVVGCAKMFEDAFLGMVPGNAMLLLNAVDALTLGDDLIQIRAKVTASRTIKPLADSAKLFIRLLVVGLMPILIAALGITRYLRRRQEEARFLAAQGGR